MARMTKSQRLANTIHCELIHINQALCHDMSRETALYSASRLMHIALVHCAEADFHNVKRYLNHQLCIQWDSSAGKYVWF